VVGEEFGEVFCPTPGAVPGAFDEGKGCWLCLALWHGDDDIQIHAMTIPCGQERNLSQRCSQDCPSASDLSVSSSHRVSDESRSAIALARSLDSCMTRS
jgi:hypothetical protein